MALHGGLRLYGNAMLIQDYIAPDDMVGDDMLEIPNGAGQVTIEGLTFAGYHAGDWTNAQMAAIGIRGLHAQDITIRNCAFHDLVGFSVHNEAGGQRINVTHCTFNNCGNGINVNASDKFITDNTLVNSEGIEAVGNNTTIARNHITRALCVGISAGGSTSPGAHIIGMVIEDNEIYGVSECGGHAIVLADGLDGAIVRGNTIDGADGYGITNTLTAVGTFIWNTLIENNTIANVSTYGIILQFDANMTGSVVRGNRVGDGSAYGLYVREPNAIIEGNDLRGNHATADLAYSVEAAGATNQNNLYNTLDDDR